MTDRRVAAAFAPGKLILFGEHAVLYGAPAIGASLSRGVRVRLASGQGRVDVALADGIPAPLGTDAAAQPAELVHAALGGDALGLDAQIELGVPACAGLGSSSALAVATLRAHASWRGGFLEASALLDRAIEVEGVAHGRSSGLDPAIASYGGLVHFRRHEQTGTIALEVLRLKAHASVHLVVGALGAHGGTRTRVSGIAQQAARPEVRAALALLGTITEAARRALEGGELEHLGQLADLAGGVLSGLGLVSDDLEALLRALRRGGALGAKMSGAGGSGGAFFAVAPDIQRAQALAAEAERRGAVAWVETIG